VARPDDRLVDALRRESFLPPGGEELERDIRGGALRCARVVEAVARFAPPAAPLRVLEVGLGSGYVAAALRHRFGDGVRLWAVDHPSRAPAHDPELRTELERRGIAFEQVDLAGGRLEAFAGERWHAAVLSEVIEHLSPPLVPQVLGALGERLVDDGVVVVTSPNLRSFHRRVSFALGRGRLLDPPLPLDEADGTLGHVRLYGRAEIEELAGAAQLEVVHWEYADWETALFAGGSVRARVRDGSQRLAARLAPALGTAWLAVLRRP